ncbi:MAG: hypothetical protein ACTIL0_07105 [Microbacterium gubbeenense]
MSAFMDMLYRHYGSHQRAEVLFEYVYGGKLSDPEDVAEAVQAVWSGAHLPAQNLGVLTWIDLFQIAGYTVDGKRAERPTEPVTLYRLAEPRFVHRLAWTASIDVAERFTEINRARYGDRTRHIYTLTVQPERLLAHITDRDEDEYVTDTRGLKAKRVTTTKEMAA